MTDIPQDGYYWTNATAARLAFETGSAAGFDAVRCLNPAACIFNSTTFESQCADGYVSVLCALCKADFGRNVGSRPTCTKCLSSALSLTLVVGISLTFLGGITFTILRGLASSRQSRPRKSARLSLPALHEL